MREEQLTSVVAEWLTDRGWQVVWLHFPHAGGGLVLHPNERPTGNAKQLNSWIPDIVCTRRSVALAFEVKNRFHLPDFQKLERIREGTHSRALLTVTGPCKTFAFGVALPSANGIRALRERHAVDFIVGVDVDQVQVLFQKDGLLP